MAAEEARVYLSHVLALIVPGHPVASLSVHPNTSGSLKDWRSEDYALLIEQGRLQVARQRQELENVRSRAQFLFTTSLGVFAIAVGLSSQIKESLPASAIWAIAVVVALASLLGAASVVVARKDYRDVDATLVSQQHSPVSHAVSKAYAESVSAGENTVATQITVFRDAVSLLIISFLLLSLAYVISIL